MDQRAETLSVPKPETKQPQWTPEYAARTLFLSFRFSQGDLRLQDDFFNYLHNIRPTWSFSDETFRTATRQHAISLAREFLLPETARKDAQPLPRRHTTISAKGTPITTESINEEIDRALGPMTLSLHNGSDTNEGHLPTNIVSNMLEADLSYKKRPRDIPDSTKPKSDPRSSFVIDYALRGAKTGLVEFDEMFRGIKDYIEQQRAGQTTTWRKEIQPKLKRIIKRYNKYHPNNQFAFA